MKRPTPSARQPAARLMWANLGPVKGHPNLVGWSPLLATKTTRRKRK